MPFAVSRLSDIFSFFFLFSFLSFLKNSNCKDLVWMENKPEAGLGDENPEVLRNKTREEGARFSDDDNS